MQFGLFKGFIIYRYSLLLSLFAGLVPTLLSHVPILHLLGSEAGIRVKVTGMVKELSKEMHARTFYIVFNTCPSV